MAKGMSLEEFRAALSSDATIENDNLKAQLEKVKRESAEELNKYRIEAERYKSWCGQLANRCLALTGGAMCLHCSISGCPYALDNNDWDAICRLMKKSHMERTPETALAVSEFIKGRQMKKLRRGLDHVSGD